jgi:hypothetical protein
MPSSSSPKISTKPAFRAALSGLGLASSDNRGNASNCTPSSEKGGCATADADDRSVSKIQGQRPGIFAGRKIIFDSSFGRIPQWHEWRLLLLHNVLHQRIMCGKRGRRRTSVWSVAGADGGESRNSCTDVNKVPSTQEVASIPPTVSD